MTAQSNTATPVPRLGPRPLPFHLATAGLTWASSLGAWPLSRSGWLPLNEGLRERAARLQRDLAAAPIEGFTEVLAGAVVRRLNAFLAGIEAYRAHPYRRPVPDLPALWQEGTTRLLDYGAAGRERPPVLVVPSLINRAYVLDLTAERSLLRYLMKRGLRPLLVDWDAPGVAERGFTLTDYIAGRLEAALDAALEAAGRPVALMGYCMGGLLALALAQRRARDVTGLALLATPWDFHAGPVGTATVALGPLGWWLESGEPLPVDMIQLLFAALDPQVVMRKFVAFSRLDMASDAAAAFVALEDWLNDGVPLAAPVARECLGGWYGRNTPGRGLWRVAGRPVVPQDLRLETLVVVPAHDRIVPPDSALSLAAGLSAPRVLRPAQGHIGMVVSAAARDRVWRPLARWLLDRG
jgi:polyhydroxyalkanoate synthase